MSSNGQQGRRRGAFRVGTSGYQYNHWRRIFYPDDLSREQWFDHYARHFDTVEINNTFYNLPSEKTFDHWRDKAPRGFLFVLKFSRYGSHLKRLKDPGGTIGVFLERARRLGEQLGPVLVQLPPHWNANPDRLSNFLEHAPRDLRWAVEFRDPSWLCEDVYELLRAHNAALVIHDMIPDHPRVCTADWTYLRFHGASAEGDYTSQALTAWAARIRDLLAGGRDVYAYFNNDVGGYALYNAADLMRFVQQADTREGD